MRTYFPSTFELSRGMGAEVWGRLQEAVAGKGGSEDALLRLAGDEGQPLIEAIADMLITEELKAENRFPVIVDYGLPLPDMIEAGNYDHVGGSIVSHPFEIEGQGTVSTEVVLLNFNRYLSSKEVIRALDAIGLVPARIEHLLALGAQYPNLQRDFQIICLGSVMVDGNERNVPYLSGYRDERYLAYDWYGGRWHPKARFAALRT